MGIEWKKLIACEISSIYNNKQTKTQKSEHNSDIDQTGLLLFRFYRQKDL